GQEDFMGDMDFKVAGTKKGITALQMDIKIGGVSRELLQNALAQAREARLYILDRMLEVIPAPREEVSAYAPKMYRLKINPELIGTLIGPGGKTVRKIQENAGGATIDIEEDGSVFVGAINEEMARKAIQMIEGLTKEVQVGEIYTGKVTRLLNFGAFVEILPGKEGLIHISELAPGHIDRVEDEVDVGDEVTVMVTEIDSLGRINLSRKAVLLGEDRSESPPPDRGRGGRGGGRPRNGGGRQQPSGGRGGDRERDRSRGGGAPRGREFGGGQQRGAPPTGGASRGWVRRGDSGFDGPPAPPPPPRPGLGGASRYDD